MRLIEWECEFEPNVGSSQSTVRKELAVPGLAKNEFIMAAWLEPSDQRDARVEKAEVDVHWWHSKTVYFDYLFRKPAVAGVERGTIRVIVTEGPSARTSTRAPARDDGQFPELNKPDTSGEDPPGVALVGIGGSAIFQQTMVIGWAGKQGEYRRITLELRGMRKRDIVLSHTLVSAPGKSTRAMVTLPPPQPDLLAITKPMKLTGRFRLELLNAQGGQDVPTQYSRRFYLESSGRMLSSVDLDNWQVPHAAKFIQIPGPPANAVLDHPFALVRQTAVAGLDVQSTAQMLFGFPSVASKAKRSSVTQQRLYVWWTVQRRGTKKSPPSSRGR